ncbi:MAG: metallophosphoesterase [Proteobacteria bacterium]|nr:metallophosphoesterase [Pseudomonadota bacterium]
MRKAIFIADAHLKSPYSQEYVDLVDFLKILIKDDHLSALFILGDFFDFFVGFPHIVFYEHLEVMGLLKELEKKGISIFYLEGNHDFFLKKLNKYGCKINFISDYLALNINGKFYLSHGDLIYKRNYSHRIMTFFIKNRITNLFSYILPPHLVYHFAHLVSRFSRERIREDFNENQLDNFVEKALKDNYSGAILGHFHKKTVIRRNHNDKIFTVYLLGSWQIDRSYLVYENGNLFFETFKK